MTKQEEKVVPISSIDNQYTKQQMQQFQKEQKRLVFRRRRLALLFVFAAIVFALVGVNLYHSYQELQVLQQEKQTVKQTDKVVTQKKDDLKDEVALLKDDEYVQKLVRSKYFFSKEGEQVYSFPQEDTTKANEKTSTEESKAKEYQSTDGSNE